MNTLNATELYIWKWLICALARQFSLARAPWFPYPLSKKFEKKTVRLLCDFYLNKSKVDGGKGDIYNTLINKEFKKKKGYFHHFKKII